MAEAKDTIKKIKEELEKAYKDSTELFPDFTSIKEIAVISSNSAVIDAVTGVGGFPRGRITEVYGPESSGKTTFATGAAVACQQSNDGVVLYLDYEHAFDAGYAHTLGLDLRPDRFVFCQPDHFEQGAAITDRFVDAGLVDLIVADSAAAMIPKDELEGKADAVMKIGLQARLMSAFLNRITKKIPRGRKPAVVILNQTRTRIDVHNPRNNGPDSAAGMALRFYSSIRLSLEITSKEGEGLRNAKGTGTDQVYTQNRVRITAVKNKLASPFIRGTLVLEYGKGINNVVSVAELAEAKLGIMSGAGFFKYVGDKPNTSFNCRGRQEFLSLLENNIELLSELEEKVLGAIRADHAKTLGLTGKLERSGKAKELESDEVVVLSASTELNSNEGGLLVEE